ncbi:unnamed protein product, partial [Bubo scandiacus]
GRRPTYRSVLQIILVTEAPGTIGWEQDDSSNVYCSHAMNGLEISHLTQLRVRCPFTLFNLNQSS